MSKRRVPPEGREHKKDDHCEPPKSYWDGRDRHVILDFANLRLAEGEPPWPAAYARAPMQRPQLAGSLLRDAGILNDGGCHAD